MSDSYDPNQHRSTDRRPHLPWIIKYWQVIVAAAMLSAGGAAFYFSSVAVAQEVQTLKGNQSGFVTKEVLEFKHEIINGRIDNLSEKVEDNENRTSDQLSELNEKLDKVLDHLINK